MIGDSIFMSLAPSGPGKRCVLSAAGLFLCVVAGLAGAQTPKYGVHEKAIERISEAREVGPLKVDGMFGDSLSMYNGSVDFGVADVSVPGNSGLPVELRRRFNVADRRETTIVTWFDHFGGFAEWDLDIPYLSDRPGFSRHLRAVHYGNHGGGHEQQVIYGRVQARSG